jgi:hypothetical protein
MAADPALSIFLALDDEAVAAYAEARAQAIGLALPPETRAGVIENLTLLRRQTVTFVAGLDIASPQAPEPFEP